MRIVRENIVAIILICVVVCGLYKPSNPSGTKTPDELQKEKMSFIYVMVTISVLLVVVLIGVLYYRPIQIRKHWSSAQREIQALVERGMSRTSAQQMAQQHYDAKQLASQLASSQFILS